jgi:methionyl-tRNA formyltransferase
MSLSPSYLPYYASFENEIIGKYGGAHPAGDLCTFPVDSVEVAVREYLQTYFLRKVPIIGGEESSPAKTMTRITYAKQVLVMGEPDAAWSKACKQVFNIVRGLEVVTSAEGEEIGGSEAADAQANEEKNEARQEAIAKFLRQQIVLKNGEIELIEKQMQAAQKQLQDKVDELHALHKKYSIF